MFLTMFFKTQNIGHTMHLMMLIAHPWGGGGQSLCANFWVSRIVPNLNILVKILGSRGRRPWRFLYIKTSDFPFFYPTQVYLGSNLWVRVSETLRGLADLTDVTLADEDTNSILTDNANWAIQCNVAMQVTQPGGQTQVVPSCGQICI